MIIRNDLRWLEMNSSHLKTVSILLPIYRLIRNFRISEELRKIEETKDKVMGNSYTMLQIKEAVGRSQMFFKIGVLKNFVNFSRKHLRWSLFLIKLHGWKCLQLYEKETPTQLFSCEICEIFKNTPSRHTTSFQRLYDVYTTSGRRMDVV